MVHCHIMHQWQSQNGAIYSYLTENLTLHQKKMDPCQTALFCSSSFNRFILNYLCQLTACCSKSWTSSWELQECWYQKMRWEEAKILSSRWISKFTRTQQSHSDSSSRLHKCPESDLLSEIKWVHCALKILYLPENHSGCTEGCDNIKAIHPLVFIMSCIHLFG